MSTRSIIAIAEGDTWRGRYCHSDGYPTWNGRVIWNEVRAAGLPALEAFLDDDGRGAWGISVIYPGFLTDPREEGWESRHGGSPNRDEQANYRVYRDRVGEHATPWRTPDDLDNDCWEEWLYICSPAGLMVVELGDEQKCLGLFRWDQDEPDWERLESGEVISNPVDA